MKTTFDAKTNELTITLTVNKNAPANDKGNKNVASSGGFVTTDVQVDGKPLKLCINGIIKS